MKDNVHGDKRGRFLNVKTRVHRLKLGNLVNDESAMEACAESGITEKYALQLRFSDFGPMEDIWLVLCVARTRSATG